MSLKMKQTKTDRRLAIESILFAILWIAAACLIYHISK